MPDDEGQLEISATAPVTITDATDAVPEGHTAEAATTPALPAAVVVTPPASGMRDDAADAATLLITIKGLPGVPKAISDRISGTTPAEIQASLAAAQAMYTTIRAAVVAEFGAEVPVAHGGAGAPPPPATPFDAIRQGLDQK